MASFLRQSALRIPRSHFSTAAAAAAAMRPPPPPAFPNFRAAKSAILSERDPEKLAHLFEQCSHFGTFRRHRPLYHRSIAMLTRANRLDLVDRVISNQAQNSDPKSEGFWIRLMMLYSNAGMSGQALKVVDRICDTKNCDLTEKSLCAFLTLHLKSKSLQSLDIPELLKTASARINVKPTALSHNLVLKAFVQLGDLNSAVNWIEEMEKAWNVKPTVDSYAILLKAHLKKGNLSGFDGFVKEIAKKCLECNLTTYNLRIIRLCKSKECARAKKLLDEMLTKGIEPNSTSYNTIIDGFCRLGDFESSKKVLDSMMQDQSTRPSSHPYYSLIRGMVKEGEFELALEVCKEIMKRKWIPPFEAMQGLVKGLVKMSRGEEAKAVVEKMKKRLKSEAMESWGKIEATLPL